MLNHAKSPGFFWQSRLRHGTCSASLLWCPRWRPSTSKWPSSSRRWAFRCKELPSRRYTSGEQIPHWRWWCWYEFITRNTNTPLKTLWSTFTAIETGHSWFTQQMVIFDSYVNVYQRVWGFMCFMSGNSAVDHQLFMAFWCLIRFESNDTLWKGDMAGWKLPQFHAHVVNWLRSRGEAFPHIRFCLEIVCSPKSPGWSSSSDWKSPGNSGRWHGWSHDQTMGQIFLSSWRVPELGGTPQWMVYSERSLWKWMIWG